MASGSPSPRAFGYYDRRSSSWRTSPPSADADSTGYSATWPRSGMTRRGQAFELPTSAPSITATVSSSSVIDQKPTVSCKLLPTPTASDNHGTHPLTETRHQVTLPDVLGALFPLPDNAPGVSTSQPSAVGKP